MFLLFAAVHVPELTTILPAIVAGAVAVYVLLPRPRPLPWWLGGALAAVAVVLTGATILRTGAVTVETFLFYAFSAIAVISGGLLVTQHNPARAALSFAVVILSTCGLFLLLAAPFLAAAAIIIYAGAIIVTFLFVLMLAQQTGRSNADDRSREPLLATFTGFLLLGTLCYVLQISYKSSEITELLDQVLARTRDFKTRVDAMDQKELAELHSQLVAPVNPLIETAEPNSPLSKELRAIRDHIDNKVGAADADSTSMKKALRELEHDLSAFRHAEIWQQERPVNSRAAQGVVSDLSGPSITEDPGNLRFDDQGRPQLPAQNTGYLGRSLFTDYLLAVELGGFLLLVAAIGAIAIAHRHAPSERSV
jgi:NADH-quinone oxidoreductase subunit J